MTLKLAFKNVCATCVILAIVAFQLAFAEADQIEPQRTGTAHSVVPVNVIFDTDIWSDIDDMLALAMLHALHDRREINLVAVTVSSDEKSCASYVDLVDTFYGHAQVPVGIVHNGMTAEIFRQKFPPTAVWPMPSYTRQMSQKRNEDGSLRYPHRLIDGTQAPEAVSLLRRTLAAQPDDSVVMIQVGFSTNLARLLSSGPDTVSALSGRDLIKKKVRFLSVMAGTFDDVTVAGKTVSQKGSPEFNLLGDVPSAQQVFSAWPTPIVASGAEIGMALLYPGKTIASDYGYADHHPIAETYRYFCEERKGALLANGGTCTHDHPTFDLTSVLYAARPDRGYFSLSKPGRIAVLPDGSAHFEESSDGTHRYLILSEEQKARTLEAMVMLASQPPRMK